jgi:hypothetical protein
MSRGAAGMRERFIRSGRTVFDFERMEGGPVTRSVFSGLVTSTCLLSVQM